MNTLKTSKPKIEAIYPLTAMQQGLLFHHLMEGEDQGFLLVQCDIKGTLDLSLFKQAWTAVTARHEIMRSTVHWKKVERPVVLVRPDKEMNWSFLDWTDKTADQREILLETHKNTLKSKGALLEKSPLSHLHLIKKDEESYYLLWECHHLLLDGWSSTIILRDACALYDALCTGIPATLPAIPSYKTYSNWLKNLSLDEAEAFWAQTFKNFAAAPLLQQHPGHLKINAPAVHTSHFSVGTSGDLKKLARTYKVTLNTLFQGIWAMVLSKCFDAEDVTFGTTVSGRSIPFPNIERMAGMFANVLPVRSQYDPTLSIAGYLQELQKQQQEARNYEYSKLDQIISWANLPEDKALFDTLFVFENFPWEDIVSGGISVQGFESGITTTYPLTAIFKIEEYISCELLINKEVIPASVAAWFLESITAIATSLLAQSETSVGKVLEGVEVIPNALSRKRILNDLNLQETFAKKETDYIAPRNQVELSLVEIWEQLFGINYISITDSFFYLGGKSLLSVRMFALIEEKLGVKLPPTVLLESPTIEALASIIKHRGDREVKAWKYLVPIKTKGDKAPLFCIHAGGGHVFFYKSLADAIDVQRPVYALQPVGIFGEEDKHQSIQSMARDYADEISLIQTEGTIHIVVYCFSTAVGLEMVAYLKSLGRDAHLIVADTIAEHRLLLDKERLSIRVSAFLKRFFSNPFKALQMMIGYRLLFYVKPIKIKLFGNDAEKNTEQMRVHLVDLFNAYQWKTKIDRVSLILTEKGDERYNQEIERSWKPLVKGAIAVETCKGHHATFFDYPDVVFTARAMDQVIEKN